MHLSDLLSTKPVPAYYFYCKHFLLFTSKNGSHLTSQKKKDSLNVHTHLLQRTVIITSTAERKAVEISILLCSPAPGVCWRQAGCGMATAGPVE